MAAESSSEHEETHHGDSMIDDLIRDILNDAARNPAVAARGRPSASSTLIDVVLAGGMRPTPGGSVVERLLIAEVLAGALADALAPALAEALAPRLIQIMGGEGGGGSAAGQRGPAEPRKAEAK